MRGLVFAILAASIVALVQGHRYRGPRFINLGITGILAPVYAGYNRGTLSRFGSISGSSLSRTFGSTFLAGGLTGGRTVGFSSVYPITTRSTTIRGVAPFSGGFQSYTDFGGVPSVPGDGPYGFDGPSSGFGPGGDYPGPLGGGGPLSVDGFDSYPGDGPLDGPSPYDGFEPYNGDGGLSDLGPLDGDGPYIGGGGRIGGLGPLSGGGISGGFYTSGYGPSGYDYEASLGSSGAGYDPYRDGVGSLYSNPYAGLDGGFDLSDGFSSSGFSSTASIYGPGLPYYPPLGSRSGGAYDLDGRGGYGYLYNDLSGPPGFDGDFSVSGGGPGLDINLRGGDGLGFNTQFGALDGQGALDRGTGSSGLEGTLGPLEPNLAYNTDRQ